jgi:hypothetical protein
MSVVRDVFGEVLGPYAEPGQQPYDPYAGQPQPQQQEARFDPYTGQPLGPPPLPELDPLDRQFGENLRATIERVVQDSLTPIQEAMQPISATAQDWAAERGRQQAISMFGNRDPNTGLLTGLAAQVGGEFDHDRAMERAARYHYEGVPGPQALERAARDQFEFEKSIRQQAIDQYTATLGGNTRTSPEPPVGGTPPAAPAPGVPTGPRRYEEQLQRSPASLDGRQPPGMG